MKKKAIIFQIEMLYHANEDVAQEVYERDLEFFKEMAYQFNRWPLNPEEPREPINFDLRHMVGEVEDEEE